VISSTVEYVDHAGALVECHQQESCRLRCIYIYVRITESDRD